MRSPKRTTLGIWVAAALLVLQIQTTVAAVPPAITWARFVAGNVDAIYNPKILADPGGGFYLYSLSDRPLIRFRANKEIDWEMPYARGSNDIAEVRELDLLDTGDVVGLFFANASGSPVRLFGQSFTDASQFVIRFGADGSAVQILPVKGCAITALAAVPNGFSLAGFGSGTATIGEHSLNLGAGSFFLSRFETGLSWTRIGKGTASVGSDSIQKIRYLPETSSLLIAVSIRSPTWNLGGDPFSTSGELLLRAPLDGSGSMEIFAGPTPGLRAISVEDGRVTVVRSTLTAQHTENGSLRWEHTATASLVDAVAGDVSFGIGTANSPQPHWFVMALDQFGDAQWLLREPSRAPSYGRVIARLKTGEILFAGEAGPEGIFLEDFFAGDFGKIGFVASGVVLATIDPRAEAPPSFRRQPRSQRFAVEGERLELSAEVYSPTPPTFQWFKDGQALDGETQSTLILPIAAAASAGSYRVDAINPFGTRSSRDAEVVVNRVKVVTLAGSGEFGFVDNADPLKAQFRAPGAVLALPNGAILIADTTNHVIRKLDANGVTTFAGAGGPGSLGGDPARAQFDYPRSLAVKTHPPDDSQIFVGDSGNKRVRAISLNAVTATARSVSENEPAIPLTPQAIAWTEGLAPIPVADALTPTVWRFVDAEAGLWAGGTTAEILDGPWQEARFQNIAALAMDVRANVHVADYLSIRKISPDGQVSTRAREIGDSASLAVEGNDSIYIASCVSNHVFRLSPTFAVTLIAGSGVAGFADGAGPDAQFHWPRSIAVRHNGNIIVADELNNRIREIRFEPLNITATAAHLEITVSERLIIRVKGESGSQHIIESASSLAPGESWIVEGTVTLNAGNAALELDRRTDIRFYRARAN